MRALQERDFDQMAERVVDRFMDGAKLADAATAEAMNGALNPDQIARMVQAANTQAFLRLMDRQKAQGVPDMTHEFDPIDTHQIIQQLVAQTPMPHASEDGVEVADDCEPSEDAGPLPDEMMRHNNGGDELPSAADLNEVDANAGPFPKGLKQRANDRMNGLPQKTASVVVSRDESKDIAFRARRMRKLAGILEDQYKQAEWVFEDVFAELMTQFKVASNASSLDAFEKDALALHGDPLGVVVLNIVKLSQGQRSLEDDEVSVKTAALIDRHLVEDTTPNRLFAKLVNIVKESSRLQEGAAYARAQCD